MFRVVFEKFHENWLRIDREISVKPGISSNYFLEKGAVTTVYLCSIELTCSKNSSTPRKQKQTQRKESSTPRKQRHTAGTAVLKTILF